MALTFAGIRRKTEFSPNHVVNDSLIVKLTADGLQKLGASVKMYDEAEVTTERIPERLIFSMVQGPAGTTALLETAASGAFIINSPQSVMNCYRVNMIGLLPRGGIPFPKSVVVETKAATNGLPAGFTAPKVWIKRGDVHAVHKEDVTLAYTEEERVTILKEFHRRGIERAVLQEHLIGDTVKFYALRESEFFYWYYLNGANHTPFAQEHLYELAQASAEALGLFVFGGDAIIAPDGTVTIIDINDWPSFAPIRDAPSQQIAQFLYRKAEEHVREHR